MASVPRRPGLSYAGLALNEKGAARAAAAGCDEINFVVVCSDTFNRRNQGVSTVESLRAWEGVAGTARAERMGATLTLAAAFGCPYEGEIPVARVAETAAAAAAIARPDEIVLADTIGAAVPPQVQAVVEAVGAAVPGVPLRAHFHNTRNTGYANVFAALAAGVATFDASLGGIGGCPFAPAATGNIATEDLIYMLGRAGRPTQLSLEALCATSDWLGGVLGRATPGLVAKAGPFPPGREESA